MEPVQTFDQLLKEIQKPGVMGLKHEGEIKPINRTILLYSPVIELAKEFNKGNLFICPN